MPIDVTRSYYTLRLRNPSEFQSGTFRTQDVGEAGRTMRRAARLKRTGRWETQSWMFSKNAYYLIGQKIYGRDAKSRQTLSQVKQQLRRYHPRLVKYVA